MSHISILDETYVPFKGTSEVVDALNAVQSYLIMTRLMGIILWILSMY